MKGFVKKFTKKKEEPKEESKEEVQEEVKPEPPRERGHYTVFTPGNQGLKFRVKG